MATPERERAKPQIQWITASDLFNKLQFGSNMMLIDLRSQEQYDRAHIRSSMHLDWAQALQRIDDDDEYEDESALLEHLAGTYDRRFKLRSHFQVVCYAGLQQGLDGKCCAEGLSGRDLAVSFAEALIVEGKIANDVLLLEGGMELFVESKPFLVKGLPQFADIQFPSEVIEEFLYLGSFSNASNRSVIDHLSITHVVNITDDCPSSFEDDLRYLECRVDDAVDGDIAQYFDTAMAFIEQALSNEGRVLVHCKMGMSRSAAIIVLYLMKSRRWSLKRTVEFVRWKRPFINPNPSFLKQLANEEEVCLGKRTIRFPEEPLTMRSRYDWLSDDGKQWIPRTVYTGGGRPT